jgi:DNA-directed RNA polymerase specialized sigma24 family protein
MDHLPADARALLGRVYGEGWRIAAAAKETGRSEAAVYKTLQRARHWLRDCITRRLEEAGT